MQSSSFNPNSLALIPFTITCKRRTHGTKCYVITPSHQQYMDFGSFIQLCKSTAQILQKPTIDDEIERETTLDQTKGRYEIAQYEFQVVSVNHDALRKAHRPHVGLRRRNMISAASAMDKLVLSFSPKGSNNFKGFRCCFSFPFCPMLR
ncbi:unnamed protein product [Lupinus luteus]|uniref:Uncharacterized protein n=1 Tax=Lupinus luteus TaxID=3873 RepID=A0AAV1YMA6_LUPLU